MGAMAFLSLLLEGKAIYLRRPKGDLGSILVTAVSYIDQMSGV